MTPGWGVWKTNGLFWCPKSYLMQYSWIVLPFSARKKAQAFRGAEFWKGLQKALEARFVCFLSPPNLGRTAGRKGLWSLGSFRKLASKSFCFKSLFMPWTLQCWSFAWTWVIELRPVASAVSWRGGVTLQESWCLIYFNSSQNCTWTLDKFSVFP